MKKFMPKLYHMSEYDDNKDKNIEVKSTVVSTAKIGEETESIDVDDNVTFKLNVKFIKRYNGWKVLNTFINKIYYTRRNI